MGLGPRPLTFGKSNAEASEFRASPAPSRVPYSGFTFLGPEWGTGPGTISTPVAPEGNPVTAGEMLCLTGGVPRALPSPGPFNGKAPVWPSCAQG